MVKFMIRSTHTGKQFSCKKRERGLIFSFKWCYALHRIDGWDETSLRFLEGDGVRSSKILAYILHILCSFHSKLLIVTVYLLFGVYVYAFQGQFTINPANQG